MVMDVLYILAFRANKNVASTCITSCRNKLAFCFWFLMFLYFTIVVNKILGINGQTYRVVMDILHISALRANKNLASTSITSCNELAFLFFGSQCYYCCKQKYWALMFYSVDMSIRFLVKCMINLQAVIYHIFVCNL